MNSVKRSTVVLSVGLLVVVLLAIGGTLVVFGGTGAEEVPPPSVDDLEDEAVLQQSIAHLRSTDHIIYLDHGHVTNESEFVTTATARTQIQNSEQRSYSDMEVNGRERQQYVNCAGVWVRDEDNSLYGEGWQERQDGWEPGRVNSVGDVDVSPGDFEVEETETQLMFEIHEDEVIEDFHTEYHTSIGTAELTVHVDKNTGKMKYNELSIEIPDQNDRRSEMEIEYADVTVEQPEELSFSKWERLNQWIDCTF